MVEIEKTTPNGYGENIQNVLMRRSFLIASLSLILFFSVFYFFYLMGIPYEQEEGITRGWIPAVNRSWASLLGNVLNPMSEQLTAGGGMLDKVRVTELLILKGLYEIFGESMTAVALYNVLLVDIFSVLLLYLGYRATGSVLIGFLYSAFLLTTPAYGWCIMEYGDFSPLDQILIILYLVFLLFLFRNEKNRSPGQTLSSLLNYGFLWLLGMMTIRAKETNLFLVPALSWGLIILYLIRLGKQEDARLNRKHIVSLSLVAVLLTLPVFWVRGGAGEPVFPLSKEDIFRPLHIFFYNPDAYAGSNVFTFFTIEGIFPSTVFSNFGFFLSWLILFALLHFGLCRSLPLKPGTPFSHERLSWAVVFMIWTMTGAAFFIVFDGLRYTRYLTWVLLSFTYLVAMLFAWNLQTARGRVRTVLLIVVLALTGVQISLNVSHSLYVRKGLERVWAPTWMIREAIYKDRTGGSDPSLFELYQYWKKEKKFLWSLVPLLHHESDQKDLFEDDYVLKLVREHGKTYVAGSRTLEFPEPLRGTLIKQIDGAKLSILTSLKYRLSRSKKRPPQYYLYQVTLKGAG